MCFDDVRKLVKNKINLFLFFYISQMVNNNNYVHKVQFLSYLHQWTAITHTHEDPEENERRNSTKCICIYMYYHIYIITYMLLYYVYSALFHKLFLVQCPLPEHCITYITNQLPSQRGNEKHSSSDGNPTSAPAPTVRNIMIRDRIPTSTYV